MLKNEMKSKVIQHIEKNSGNGRTVAPDHDSEPQDRKVYDYRPIAHLWEGGNVHDRCHYCIRGQRWKRKRCWG